MQPNGPSTFNCWFQHADFSIDELGPLSEAAAIDAFRKIDVDAQGALLAKLDDEQKDWCQFGFGMNGPNGELVHLYCVDSTSFLYEISVQWPQRKKLFGMLPITRRLSRIFREQTIDNCCEVISKAYRSFASLFVE